MSVSEMSAYSNSAASRASDPIAAAAPSVTELDFRFRTVDEVYALAEELASYYPDPARAQVGITELLVNAVEHGNLELTYAEKSRLGGHDAWRSEVEDRLASPRYRDRWVHVRLEVDASHITISIRDEGRGFDCRPYLDFEVDRLMHTHGRGIAMALNISFDRLEYRDGGREAVATAMRINKA